MKGPRCARVAVIGLLAAMLSACGSDPDQVLQPYDGGEGGLPASDVGVVEGGLPTRYGLYAVQDGRIGRLDGERSFQVETWESRSALQPDVQFIVFDRALDDRSVRLQNAIEMRRLAHVRNDVSATGAVTPTGRDIWVVADLPELAVPLAELLDDPGRCAELGEAARAAVLDEHPLVASLGPILERIESLPKLWKNSTGGQDAL